MVRPSPFPAMRNVHVSTVAHSLAVAKRSNFQSQPHAHNFSRNLNVNLLDFLFGIPAPHFIVFLCIREIMQLIQGITHMAPRMRQLSCRVCMRTSIVLPSSSKTHMFLRRQIGNSHLRSTNFGSSPNGPFSQLSGSTMSLSRL